MFTIAEFRIDLTEDEHATGLHITIIGMQHARLQVVNGLAIILDGDIIVGHSELEVTVELFRKFFYACRLCLKLLDHGDGLRILLRLNIELHEPHI